MQYKIIMVVAQDKFRDEEFEIPYKEFIKNDFKVDIASSRRGKCKGSQGMEIKANKSLEEVNAENYDAVVIVGGQGAKNLVGNKELIKLLKDSGMLNKIIAAICYSPVILARAGLLKNRHATVWNGDNLQKQVFDEEGVIYEEKEVVADGRIITANGPAAAQEFARTIISMLNKS